MHSSSSRKKKYTKQDLFGIIDRSLNRLALDKGLIDKKIQTNMIDNNNPLGIPKVGKEWDYPSAVTGLIDADGCFYIGFNQNTQQGISFNSVFEISQINNKLNKDYLKRIQIL